MRFVGSQLYISPLVASRFTALRPSIWSQRDFNPETQDCNPAPNHSATLPSQQRKRQQLYKPEQGVKHAITVSVSLPLQGFPPFIAGGIVHCRVLRSSSPPAPHVREHCVQGLQGPHPPSKGPA